MFANKIRRPFFRPPWSARDVPSECSVPVYPAGYCQSGPFEVRFPGLICRALNNNVPNGRFLFFVGKNYFFILFLDSPSSRRRHHKSFLLSRLPVDPPRTQSRRRRRRPPPLPKTRYMPTRVCRLREASKGQLIITFCGQVGCSLLPFHIGGVSLSFVFSD